jgi:hypothetical protein
MMASPSGHAFNEAEDAMLVAFFDPFGDGGQRTGVLDLETGTFAELTDATLNPDGPQSPLWGPDGQVFWLDALRYLKVFDPETGESVRFSEDLGQLNGFALRPSTP